MSVKKNGKVKYRIDSYDYRLEVIIDLEGADGDSFILARISEDLISAINSIKMKIISLENERTSIKEKLEDAHKSIWSSKTKCGELQSELSIVEKAIENKKTEIVSIYNGYLKEHAANPIILMNWIKEIPVYATYGGHLYKFDRVGYSQNEMLLQINELEDKERRKYERLSHKYNSNNKTDLEKKRTAIPEEVRIDVWRRDKGKCVKCGSRDRLEYDHIIPVSKGGSNTARNIELLCERCNREKQDNIQ